MSESKRRIVLLVQGRDNGPHGITIGPLGEDCINDVVEDWDSKTPIVAWYHVSTTSKELADFSQTLDAEGKLQKHVGPLFGTEDSVRLTLPSPHISVDEEGKFMVTESALEPLKEQLKEELQSPQIRAKCLLGFTLNTSELLKTVEELVSTHTSPARLQLQKQVDDRLTSNRPIDQWKWYGQVGNDIKIQAIRELLGLWNDYDSYLWFNKKITSNPWHIEILPTKTLFPIDTCVHLVGDNLVTYTPQLGNFCVDFQISAVDVLEKDSGVIRYIFIHVHGETG